MADAYRQVAEAAREAQRSEPTARRRALSRLRRDLQLICGRDYFPTPAREQAIEAVEQLAQIGEVVP